MGSFTSDAYVKLAPYTIDFQGFFPYVRDLNKYIFNFKEDDIKTAKTILQSVKNTYRATQKIKLVENITMISIHIRLTDYENHLKVLYDMELITNEFLTQAMSYFTNKYQVRWQINLD